MSRTAASRANFPVAIRRFIPLRYRFIFLVSCTLILVLGSLAVILDRQQGQVIHRQLEHRGLAIVQSLVATSMANLVTYNHIALEQAANQAAATPDVIYVAIHDKEGRVAGFSGRPDLQGRSLDDPASRAALAANQPVVLRLENDDGLEAISPVFLPETTERWGTVRVGISLDSMRQQIRQIKQTIAVIGLLALTAGILLSSWAARRVTEPLGRLVDATVEAARGSLKDDIRINTGDEVELLAANFSVMVREVLGQRDQLETRLVEIKRLQRYTEDLLTAMGDGLFSVDANRIIVTINPAARHLFQACGLPLAPGDPLDLTLPQDSPLAAFVDAALRGASRPRELRLGPPDAPRTVLVGANLIRDDHGQPRELVLNLHDVTELKGLEARVRQAERLAALGTLAAGMAHEIRNPLSAIKTFTQLLPRKLSKPGFLERFQETVPREIDRLNGLVESLLELSRLPKYQFSRTDIRPILQDLTALLEDDLRNSRIDLVLDLPEMLPETLADPNQLVKAFQNLILNAAQAMPEGGRLTVAATTSSHPHSPSESPESLDDTWISVAISDTGLGIPPEILKNIFNPFFTTKDTGTGLGLAITHKVVTEHGGCIDVDSLPGQGTTFTVSLRHISSFPAYRDSRTGEAA